MHAKRRWAAGCIAAVLIAGSVVLWRQAPSIAQQTVPAHTIDEVPAPVASAVSPPEASPPPEPSREERRLARYDKDKDGRVSRDEYLASRRKAFAKLDRDGDGRLSFEEYAVKTSDRFVSADGNRDGRLSAVEFATTARKIPPRKPDCSAKPDDEA